MVLPAKHETCQPRAPTGMHAGCSTRAPFVPGRLATTTATSPHLSASRLVMVGGSCAGSPAMTAQVAPCVSGTSVAGSVACVASSITTTLKWLAAAVCCVAHGCCDANSIRCVQGRRGSSSSRKQQAGGRRASRPAAQTCCADLLRMRPTARGRDTRACPALLPPTQPATTHRSDRSGSPAPAHVAHTTCAPRSTSCAACRLRPSAWPHLRRASDSSASLPSRPTPATLAGRLLALLPPLAAAAAPLPRRELGVRPPPPPLPQAMRESSAAMRARSKSACGDVAKGGSWCASVSKSMAPWPWLVMVLQGDAARALCNR